MIALAARFFDHTVDDAFISFRYARNFVDGHGLVFNPGERVEGYTNFLWVVWASLSLVCSIDPEVSCRWLGLAASCATLGAVVRFSPSLRHFPLTVWIAPLLLAVNPALAVWTTGGLEAPLFACWVAWGACLAAEGVERGALPVVSAVLFGLAALTRPEGAALAGIAAGAAALLGWRQPGLRRSLAVWVTIFLALFAPYVLWRWSYYGDLLPNTYYAKVGNSAAQLRRGLGYSNEFFSVTGYWLVPLALSALWSGRRRFVAVLAIVTAFLVALVVYVGGDGFPMYRFFVPVLSPFFLLVAWGAAHWLERVARRSRGAALAAAVAFCLATAYSAVPAFRGLQYDFVQQDVREVAAWKQVGKWLRQHASPGDTVAVITAGAIPFFSGLPAIDMLGLNDRHIAHREMPQMGSLQAGHEKHDVDYVLSREPKYVIVGVYGLSRQLRAPETMIAPFYPAERRLLRHPEFMARYHAEVARVPGGFFVYFVRWAT